MWPSSVFFNAAATPEERPEPPHHKVEFTAACDVCGLDVPWFGGLRVVPTDIPGIGGTLTVSTSWTEHCGGVAA
jgi:hypothetical protein